MTWQRAALVAAGLATPSVPAFAHHSFAMFDQAKLMTLEGTVHEFQWTSPHSFRSGERISVRIAPLRNGHPGGLFLDLRKADGRTLDSGLPKNGTPVNVPQL